VLKGTALAELVTRAGTPAHLATPETEYDADLFMAVSTELGDVILGPPGTTPAELDESHGITFHSARSLGT
jgi:hypothetical protein